MVFVHGVGLDNHSWRHLLEGFRDQPILTYDLLGHGQTKQALGRQSFEPFKNQLEVLLSDLGIPQVILLGFSLGGLVAAHFAAAHPRTVNALVLISTVYKRTVAERNAIARRLSQAKDEDWTGLRAAALERWFSAGFLEANPNIREEISLRLQENNPENFLECYELLAKSDDHCPKYPDILMPTLILTGEGDQGSTPAMADELGRAIPNAQAHVITDGKHLCIIENHHEITDIIKRFLRDST